ncbi:hypothetical protein CKL83_10415 [Bacillus anthracis]|uniref:Uncharacterized protein n=2 Tax=Bacillus anthracis TaxID=1392 RepID=A0A6H3A9P1_BACAN|nr:hypothetical protein BA_0773 [Bacillus anthracis str. Ames]AAT29881.1 hypothetical protein GBAA_0773 [Bacillus anthracis str. 'Ames Ancestor']APT24404.1 hypothetical protein BVB96_04340 [Bacillus anthracis]EDR17317.1 hypothetical protein BAC_0816 [Bacillus anthracis str. A0488]EDR86129.1 hypothetical protein BAQ_0843 [Bacillus anthracis str. A0193]EDR91420.1 hypothetical protein BAH_0842 [Bacillus anthracis str. A0442]EDS95374.1 hypothetical protein BAK_0873 [Bacillus anthracis str. A0389]
MERWVASFVKNLGMSKFFFICFKFVKERHMD